MRFSHFALWIYLLDDKKNGVKNMRNCNCHKSFQCFRRTYFSRHRNVQKKCVKMSGKLSELCRNFIGKNIAICQMENNFRTWMLQVINFSRKPHWLLHTHRILLVLGWWWVRCAMLHSLLYIAISTMNYLSCAKWRKRERWKNEKKSNLWEKNVIETELHRFVRLISSN